MTLFGPMLVLAVTALGDPNAAGPATAAGQEAAPALQGVTGADLSKIVRGVYADLHAGLGYAVHGSTLPNDPTYPLLGGTSEMLGSAASLDLALGYDVLDNVGLELVGGMVVSSNRRDDRVRALRLGLLGLGVRLLFPLRERLYLSFAPHLAYASVGDEVDDAKAGAAIAASLGVEYFAHVRHLSVGADLQAFVPFGPLRAFVGLAPHVRYTF